MDIFLASQLAQSWRVVTEFKHTTRGQLFVLESLQRPKKQAAAERALRIYEADSSLGSKGLNPSLLKETQTCTLRHPGLMTIHEVELVFTCQNFLRSPCQQAHLLLLMDLASGNLRDWLAETPSDQRLPRGWELLHHVAQGLDFLHERHYVHRRINPHNVMVFVDHETTTTAKLGDFQDLSLYFQTETQLAKLQPPDPLLLRFTAPELLAGYSSYLPSADVWSFGLLGYEMLWGSGAHPFLPTNSETVTADTMLHAIFTVLGSPSEEWQDLYHGKQSRLARDEILPQAALREVLLLRVQPSQLRKRVWSQVLALLDGCLRLDPEKRWTMKQVAAHLHHMVPKSQNFQPATYHQLRPPVVPQLPQGTYKEVRREILRTAIRDWQDGYLMYQPLLAAVYLMDRSRPFFDADIFENSANGHIQKHLVYQLFGTCYQLAVKLLVPEPATDVLTALKGLVCGLTEENRLTVLFMERTVATQLRFQFFLETLFEKHSEENLGVLRALENRSFQYGRASRAHKKNQRHL
jgi:serine/threonine protein kinase